MNRLKNIEFNDLANSKIQYTINSLSDELSCLDKIDEYLKMFILKESGKETILINSSDCDLHSDSEIANFDTFAIDQAPPFKYGCSCKIEC